MPPLAVRAVVLDFDGAISPTDVTEAVLERFGAPEWRTIEARMRAGELGLRPALIAQAATLTATREEILSFALGTLELEPTFVGFVAWARQRGLRMAIASDGLGFYIEPMLRASGIDASVDIEIRTNVWQPNVARVAREPFVFPFAHPRCVGCGTCKMNAVLELRSRFGPVAFVGEGHSDRYGALYADVTFAKANLVALCVADGVAYVPWETYDDVRAGLEGLVESDVPRPPAPDPCPGWTERT